MNSLTTGNHLTVEKAAKIVEILTEAKVACTGAAWEEKDREISELITTFENDYNLHHNVLRP